MLGPGRLEPAHDRDDALLDPPRHGLAGRVHQERAAPPALLHVPSRELRDGPDLVVRREEPAPVPYDQGPLERRGGPQVEGVRPAGALDLQPVREHAVVDVSPAAARQVALEPHVDEEVEVQAADLAGVPPGRPQPPQPAQGPAARVLAGQRHELQLGQVHAEVPGELVRRHRAVGEQRRGPATPRELEREQHGEPPRAPTAVDPGEVDARTPWLAPRPANTHAAILAERPLPQRVLGRTPGYAGGRPRRIRP